MLRFFLGPAILLAKLWPETAGIQHYKKYKTHYDINGNEKPVSPNVEKLFKEVVTDINLPIKYEEKITLFSVKDLEVFFAGSMLLKHGVIIGIPSSFNYKNADDIPADITSHVNVVHDTKAGRELIKSLILSDNAQRFILAQNILSCQEFCITYEAMLLLLDIIIVQFLYQILCDKLEVFKNQKLVRFVCGSLTIFGGCLNYIRRKNKLNANTKTEVNKRILKLGPKYVEGAVEYYEKLSKRNKALRVLLGVKGTYLFTPTGNEFSLFNQKEASVCNQLGYFNTKLQDLKLAS